jgi:hypothetical protein
MNSKTQQIAMTGQEDSVTSVWAMCLGTGKYLLRRDKGTATYHDSIASKWAQVVNEQGERIGDAHQMYADGGWAVHTRPFAGYVSPDQIQFVD